MRYLIPLSWSVAGVALCYAMWYAFASAWLCDDAFISYRYAENLVDGLGLVYNAGERVEGYTNFLWVMLLSLGLLVDVDPILCSQYLGVGFYLGTIALLWSTASRPKASPRALPLAAIGLSLHGHSAVFATCGLETSMFTFFVTAGLLLLVNAERPRQFAGCGLALILATMTRPDGAVFYACASLVVGLLALRQRRFWPLAGFALPFVVIYGPYFLWKFSYYGHPFPNTFYAKSASEPYLDQGLWYVWLYFSCYWYLIPALILPAWLALRRTASTVATGFEGQRGPVVVVLFTLPYLAYVVWVGGDFMFARFCLPTTPALLLGLQFLAFRRGVAAVAGVVVILGSLLTTHGSVSVYSAYTEGAIRSGNARNVVEEKVHYPQWYLDANRILGETLARRCRGVDLRVAIGGAQAMLGYFGRFSYVLETNGLTDAYIAHRGIHVRGRVGHEKALPFDDDYYGKRRVHLAVGSYTQVAVPHDSPRMAEARKFEFWVDNVPFSDGRLHSVFAQATMLTYDADLMARLAGRPGLRFTPFPEFLDRYMPTMQQLGRDAVRQDLAAFRRFYFSHVDDPIRLLSIEAFLR